MNRVLKTFPLLIASGLTIGLPSYASPQPPGRVASTASTQGQATRALIDSSGQILKTLQMRKEEFRSDPRALRKYIDEQLDRLLDRNYAARLVLGIHARGATDAEISAFANALADNLLQRYGTALLDYSGKSTFRGRSETPLPGNRGLRVSTELLSPGEEAIPIDYLVHNVKGQWKIFDVMIEGISYVQTFRDQLDSPLREKGIKTVIEELSHGGVDTSKKAKHGR